MKTTITITINHPEQTDVGFMVNEVFRPMLDDVYWADGWTVEPVGMSVITENEGN